MTWSSDRRLDYIDWMLSTTGSIQRGHIMETFGVSQGQASADLNEFARLYPTAMSYDKSAKCYIPARSPYRRQRKGDWVDAIDWAGATSRSEPPEW